MSEIGILMCLTSIFEIGWALYGWDKIGRVNTFECEYRFVKTALALNLAIPLVSVIPIISTILLFLIVKAILLPFACFFPNTFIKLRKKIPYNLSL